MCRAEGSGAEDVVFGGGGLKVTASGMNGDTVQGFEVPVSRGTGRVKGWGSEFRA